jgi:hypothetical protein
VAEAGEDCIISFINYTPQQQVEDEMGRACSV